MSTTTAAAPKLESTTWLQRVENWDTGEADRQIREGLPIEVATEMQQLLDLTDAETARLLGRSRSTYSRRRAQSAELGVSEAERAVRVLETIALAAETFGSLDEALTWMREENAALGGVTPLSLLETGPGTTIVRDLVIGFQHGFPL